MRQSLSYLAGKLNAGNQGVWVIFVFLLLTCSPLAGAPRGEVFFLPEPRFLRPPIMEEIPGSERTVRTVVRSREGQIHHLSPEEVAELDSTNAGWREAALRAPAELWEQTEVQFLRDTDGVIIAAVLDGPAQETCSLLFDPVLVERMEDIFGPEFFVAVPSRFRLMVFPKLSSRVADFASVVLSENRVSPHPVSPEVFEVSREGVRVVGLLDDR